MSLECLTWAFKQHVSTPTSKLLLVTLANYADAEKSCYPSERHLGEVAGITERGARKCIKRLVDEGLIRIEKRGKHNRYFLIAELEGRSHRNRSAANTKEIQKKKRVRGRLNRIAG